MFDAIKTEHELVTIYAVFMIPLTWFAFVQLFPIIFRAVKGWRR